MVKHSRRYAAVMEKVDADRLYQPQEAIELVKEVSTTKFDETVEIHLRTNVDPRHADQMVRGVTVLPHGYDVDDDAGLRRLQADLSHPEIAARAPATFRAMRLLF